MITIGQSAKKCVRQLTNQNHSTYLLREEKNQSITSECTMSPMIVRLFIRLIQTSCSTYLKKKTFYAF